MSPPTRRCTWTATGTLASENGRLGKIGVVQPADPNRMQAAGSRLFSTESGHRARRPAQITGGALEESNVQPVEETTRMITEMREFQFVTQFVQGESDRQQSVIDKLTAHIA